MPITDAFDLFADARKKAMISADPGKYRHLAKASEQWMTARPPQHGATDVLRSSGLFDLCPKEFVLNYWQPRPIKKFDWKSYLFMSAGSHMHYYLQNHVLGPMGVLWGTWKHRGSVRKVEGFYPDPDEAMESMQRQREPMWEYEEIKVWNRHWRIAGHLDGEVDSNRIQFICENAMLFKKDPFKLCQELYKIPESERALLEIKTAGSHAMSRVTSPRDIPDYYKTQACAYQKLSGKKETVFWYIERDTMKSEIYPYEYDEGWWKDITRKARIIWEAIRDETLPVEALKCKLPKDKRAKACEFRDPCFLRTFEIKLFIDRGKKMAAESGRKLLDLSEWKADEET